MDPALQKEVSRLRDQGWSLDHAWRAAKAKNLFDYFQERGLVELTYPVDEEAYDDSYVEDDDAKKQLWERIEAEGVYGIVGRYRVRVDRPWVSSSAVWGFIGTDCNNNCYTPDIMRETVEELIKELAEELLRLTARGEPQEEEEEICMS